MSKEYELTDKEIGEIEKAHSGMDLALSKKVGLPVFKDVGGGGGRALVQAAPKKLLECFYKRLGIDEKEMFLTWCVPIRKWRRICKELGVE